MIDIFQSFNLSPHTLGQFIGYLNSKLLQLEIVSEIGMRLLYSIFKPIKTHINHEFGILTL